MSCEMSCEMSGERTVLHVAPGMLPSVLLVTSLSNNVLIVTSLLNIALVLLLLRIFRCLILIF